MTKTYPIVRIECNEPSLRAARIFLQREDGSEIDLKGCVLGFRIETANDADGMYSVIHLRCIGRFNITGKANVEFGLLVREEST